MIQKEVSDQDIDKKNGDSEFARPVKLPSPTYWPFFLAMGITFIFWGLLTSWVILASGILIFVIALTRWINVLIHD